MYVCLWGCTHVYRYPQRPECWILLGQKLERVVNCSGSVLGTRFGSSGSAKDTVNHKTLSPLLSLHMCVYLQISVVENASVMSVLRCLLTLLFESGSLIGQNLHLVGQARDL